jgi:hypothetical protein
LIIQPSLLCTVAQALFTGRFHSLRIGREQFDGKNMRAGLWDRKVAAVSFQELGGPLVVVLTEEIGFADSFIG